jgi:hypothetical protein
MHTFHFNQPTTEDMADAKEAIRMVARKARPEIRVAMFGAKDNLSRAGKDVHDHVLDELLAEKDRAALVNTCRAWYHHMSTRRGRTIALLLDNTGKRIRFTFVFPTHAVVCLGSMDAQRAELQVQFVEQFLAGLDSTARVRVFLVCEDARPPIWPSIAGPRTNRRVYAPLVLRDTLLPAMRRPAFYNGGRTPLLEAMVNARLYRFRSCVVVTDGEESEIKTEAAFGALQLEQTPLSLIMQRHNAHAPKKDAIHFNKKQPLDTLSKLLMLASGEQDGVFTALIGVAGVNSIVANIDGMVVSNLVDVGQVGEVARQIRLQTVPSESGGGDQSRSRGVLLGERIESARARNTNHNSILALCGERRTTFVPASSVMAAHRLLSQRKDRLTDGSYYNPVGWHVTELPSEQDRAGKENAGWYFKWQLINTPDAKAELARTQAAAATAFADVCRDRKQLDALTHKVAVLYLLDHDSKLKQRQQRRKNKSGGADGKDAKAHSTLTLAQIKLVQETLLPIDPNFDEKAKARADALALMKGIKPIPLSIYFWLMAKEEKTGTTLHERLLDPAASATAPVAQPKRKRLRMASAAGAAIVVPPVAEQSVAMSDVDDDF